MILLAEITYSEDKGDNISYQPTIFRLVDSFSPDSFTIKPHEKVEHWFRQEFPDEKYTLLNVIITEPI